MKKLLAIVCTFALVSGMSIGLTGCPGKPAVKTAPDPKPITDKPATEAKTTTEAKTKT